MSLPAGQIGGKHPIQAFGETQALAGVELTVDSGRVLALLGPNGAGKTTLVRILATLLTPDTGSARVAGFDVVRDAASVRSMIGLSGQFAAIDDLLTGRENLRWWAGSTSSAVARHAAGRPRRWSSSGTGCGGHRSGRSPTSPLQAVVQALLEKLLELLGSQVTQAAVGPETTYSLSGILFAHSASRRLLQGRGRAGA
jgi:ABC-type dipeptide/oligopeptide/nickel transport system ATPase component